MYIVEFNQLLIQIQIQSTSIPPVPLLPPLSSHPPHPLLILYHLTPTPTPILTPPPPFTLITYSTLYIYINIYTLPNLSFLSLSLPPFHHYSPRIFTK